ncbi:MAG: Rrf2 family transcriptional regulator [Phycisphaeraceae bacterium]|nr:MAG: Rrf2 family transcriptional regulator [Phycisphaeraceae bacterium]
MLSLTRKTDYALVALVSLSEDPGRARSARSLAESLRLPLPALRNILQDLARAGLLESAHGAGGGYLLARRADEISITCVVEAIEGPVRLTLCCGPHARPRKGQDPEPVPCRLEDSCRIKGAIRQVHMNVVSMLSGVTVEHLATGEVPVVPAWGGQIEHKLRMQPHRHIAAERP